MKDSFKEKHVYFNCCPLCHNSQHGELLADLLPAIYQRTRAYLEEQLTKEWKNLKNFWSFIQCQVQDRANYSLVW